MSPGRGAAPVGTGGERTEHHQDDDDNHDSTAGSDTGQRSDRESVYGTSPVKRTRATKAEMAQRRARLYELARDDQPATVRNIYYRATVDGTVAKTDSGYRKVQRDLVELRRAGALPFEWIVDHTRWMRKGESFDGVAQALEQVASFYRRDLWSDAPRRVEVWCESDSIAGVVGLVTERWNVPLFPTRGFSSVSFTYSSAQSMNEDGRPVTIYFIGDHDPAGLAIEDSLATGLAEHLTVPFEFYRVAVTWEQVVAGNLPGTKPKKAYGYPLAVEAEAMPAPELRQLLDDAIRSHVDPHRLKVLLEAERSERELLRSIAEGLVA